MSDHPNFRRIENENFPQDGNKLTSGAANVSASEVQLAMKSALAVAAFGLCKFEIQGDDKPATAKTNSTRLSDIPLPIAEKANKLIGQLNADEYKVREKASEQLTEMGKHIIPLLEESLKNPASLESKRRTERILASLETKDERHDRYGRPFVDRAKRDIDGNNSLNVDEKAIGKKLIDCVAKGDSKELVKLLKEHQDTIAKNDTDYSKALGHLGLQLGSEAATESISTRTITLSSTAKGSANSLNFHCYSGIAGQKAYLEKATIGGKSVALDDKVEVIKPMLRGIVERHYSGK